MKKVKKHFENIKLTRKESDSIEKSLLLYIEKNRVHSQVAKKESILSLFLNRKIAFAATLVAILTVSTAGTAYAANNALPGDFLYPIKVHVHEKLRTHLSFSTESKAKWETKRAKRRMQEAQQLQAEGKLTTDISSELSAQTDSHIENAQLYALKIESNNKIQIENTISDLVIIKNNIFIDTASTIDTNSTEPSQQQKSTEAKKSTEAIKKIDVIDVPENKKEEIIEIEVDVIKDTSKNDTEIIPLKEKSKTKNLIPEVEVDLNAHSDYNLYPNTH